MTTGETERVEKETGRVEAFSDGVFAIAVTLLVLDLKVPSHIARVIVTPDHDQSGTTIHTDDVVETVRSFSYTRIPKHFYRRPVMTKALFNHIAVPVSSVVVLLMIGLSSCSNTETAALQAKIDSLQTELKNVTNNEAMVEAHLMRFDSLDFDVYSHAKWDLLGVSHDDNIVVTYPDGHQTTDIKTHIEELKPMFVFAPDTRIVEHPVRFGSGDWTCVTGYILGTFSKPMPIGNGKNIRPTGKAFKLPMCTVGHWKNGKMIAENLYWDNQAFMKQIGLAK